MDTLSKYMGIGGVEVSVVEQRERKNKPVASMSGGIYVTVPGMQNNNGVLRRNNTVKRHTRLYDDGFLNAGGKRTGYHATAVLTQPLKPPLPPLNSLRPPVVQTPVVSPIIPVQPVVQPVFPVAPFISPVSPVDSGVAPPSGGSSGGGLDSGSGSGSGLDSPVQSPVTDATTPPVQSQSLEPIIDENDYGVKLSADDLFAEKTEPTKAPDMETEKNVSLSAEGSAFVESAPAKTLDKKEKKGFLESLNITSGDLAIVAGIVATVIIFKAIVSNK